jgi:hypothetical protein
MYWADSFDPLQKDKNKSLPRLLLIDIWFAGVADTADKLMPVLLLLAVNYRRVIVSGDKLIAGVMETMKIGNKA